jgi:hypothetical protein
VEVMKSVQVKLVVLAAAIVLLQQARAEQTSADDRGEETKDARYRCVDRGLKSAADLRFVDDESGAAAQLVHVAMIATNVNRYLPKAGGTPVILQLLGKMISSILAASRGTPLHVIMITDAESHGMVERAIMGSLGRHLSEGIIRRQEDDKRAEQMSQFPRQFCLELVNLESLTVPHRALIDQMKMHYARSMKDKQEVLDDGTVLYYPYEKYTLDLFFLAPFYHLAFPSTLKQLIVLDVDLEVWIDLQELHHEFELMTPRQQIGVVNDQFEMYRLYYENTLRVHKYMKINEAFGKGFNTGVVLYDLAKIRQSSTWAAEIASPAAIDQLALKHGMVGMVGDQDWLTLMGYEHPELIRILPCEFNRQVHSVQGITCQQPPKISHTHGLL